MRVVRASLPTIARVSLLLLLATQQASAASGGGISLSQTRVVFLATDKAQTLTVKNSDNQTYLIQSRVQRHLDDAASAPFIITPPLFPLRADNRQVLRILPQETASLPTDRESLFYLSVLGIPAQAEQQSASSQVSMGLRFMIKLFYRPAGLAVSQDAAACGLEFSATAQGVRVNNPTPYYQTLGELMLNHTAINLDKHPSMVAPMSTVTYAAPAPAPVTQAKWQTINDFGGLSDQCQQAVSSIKEQS
ncbi:putative fimbrial chaperone protein [Yersinia enterocolitica]|uniref:fimbrial biogenesis chaperone n=1 Tax=Yersinia mollaretii TaxID=33060 RepID=UPI0005E9757B|nr:molecular chaperone [Yersinia mollaretii]CNK21840.1 putative fimbrial chaperone protein [Yersinia enterocolitica]